MKEKSSEELVKLIKRKDDKRFHSQAKDAFREFTYRHQLSLMKKLIPICKIWGYDDHVAMEIAYQTFDRVWRYPKYDAKKANQKDEENRIQFYLFGIAKRLLVEYKKKEKGENSPFTGNEQIIYDFPRIDSINLSHEKKVDLEKYYNAVQEALDSLSFKHRIIYLTYKQYESETKSGFKLPRNLLATLREKLNLSQNTIRSYKKEAFEEVKRKIESYEKR
jgi:DNA-directed RNA polymerase specialized sigma24 family protein